MDQAERTRIWHETDWAEVNRARILVAEYVKRNGYLRVLWSPKNPYGDHWSVETLSTTGGFAGDVATIEAALKIAPALVAFELKMREFEEKMKLSNQNQRGGKRVGAGRPSLGQTRKVSLTLPDEAWTELERVCKVKGMTMSAVLRFVLMELRDTKMIH